MDSREEWDRGKQVTIRKLLQKSKQGGGPMDQSDGGKDSESDWILQRV